MALLETYSVGFAGTAVTYASNKSMFDVWNGSSGATEKVIKIWRIWFYNGVSSSITGAEAVIHVLRTVDAPSGGSTYTPVPHDSTNAAIAAGITFGSNRTITYPTTGSPAVPAPVLLKRWCYFTDEWALAGAGVDELQTFSGGALVWDGGYASAGGVIQPITLRAGQGMTMTNVSATAAGGIDAYMEFTQEAV